MTPTEIAGLRKMVEEAELTRLQTERRGIIVGGSGLATAIAVIAASRVHAGPRFIEAAPEPKPVPSDEPPVSRQVRRQRERAQRKQHA